MTDQTRPDETQRPRLAVDLALYTLARLALVAALTALVIGFGKLLGYQVPLLIALLFALIIALPLSMVLFKGLRMRVADGIAVVDEKRRHEKADLRARLRGESPPDGDSNE